MKWFIQLLCLLAAVASCRAATVTITVNGVFASGSTDYTGVFYPGTTGHALGDDPFTIVFTFDDSQGSESVYVVGGTPRSSYIVNNGGSNPGTAALTDNAPGASTTPFVFAMGSSGINSKASSVPGDSYYVAAGDDGSGITMTLYPATGSLPNSWDWRTSFGPTAVESGANYTFNIDEGTYVRASGQLSTTSASYITVSGIASSCSVTPSLSLDTSATGQQPNLLWGGGSSPETTLFSASTSPATSGVSIGLIAQYGSVPGSVTTNLAGNAVNLQYTGTTSTENDTVNGFSCGDMSSTTLPLYDFNAAAYSTTNFNFHQSQAADTIFTNSSALTAAQIQTFLTYAYKDVSNHISFLNNFYFDNTNNSGWWDSSGTGSGTETYNPSLHTGQTAYDAGGGTIVPAVGDTGILASTVISDIASTWGINPEVLLATLQKEKGLINTQTFPSTSPLVSNSTLDNAMGASATSYCPTINDFWDQLNCGAEQLYLAYNTTTTTWPSGGPYLTVGEPFFWPTETSWNNSLQYAYGSSASCSASSHSGCDKTAFKVDDHATFAQYSYTPFVNPTTSVLSTGGLWLFEAAWARYKTHATGNGYTW